ncbi:retrovirus-related pol polyprotein from transposon TNT 1-94 [Tanacetum coccineum]
MNNQLRTSSNPRQQATIYDGKVTVQPIQGRQTTYAAGTTRKYTPGASGSNTGKQRTVICYNCKGEGHIAKQCTKPKRKRDETWFNDKCCWFQAQAGGQALTEEEIAFLADPGLPDIQTSQTLSPQYCSQAISQGMAQKHSLRSELDITSGSNIIPYSQYLSETQQENSIGFEKPFCLKKARESMPKLYDGNTILKMDTIVVPDSDETIKHKVNTKPINYAILNNDYYKRFVRQTDLYCEHAYWKATSVPALDPSHSSTTVIVEVPKELPTVSMVNTSLKELKRYLTGFDQLFELSELKAQSQAKDTVIVKLKEQIKSLKGNVEDSSVKMDMDEIETLNIELEHRVTKLVAENEHLKQTYKQLYDSIKPKRVQSKEQCDALIKQVNIKSGEISDLNAKLQEQGLVIAALKNELRKLKGKAIDNEDTVTHSVDPKVSKDNMEPITPKLLNKRTAHSSYIKHSQEEALVLRDIVEHVKANYPQDPLLESAFRYTKVIQDLLSHISRSCPSINNCGPQLIEAIPRKKDKKVRFAESLTSTENTKPASTSNIVSNKRVLHSTGVRLSTSASGSQPSGNTKNDRILQTPSSNSKNKVEAHPRNVKSSLNKKNGTVNVNGSAVVQNLKKQDNSDYVCIHRDDCMPSDNLCVSNSVNVVKSRAKPKKNKSKKDIWKPTGKVFTQIGYIWRPTGRTFTIVGNACPLTRITTTNEVPSRTTNSSDSESSKPVWLNWFIIKETLVVQIVLWFLDSGARSIMNERSLQLTNFISKFFGLQLNSGNDQVAR